MMIRARNIIFNEDEIFNNNLDKMKDDYLHIDLKKLTQLLILLDTPSKSKEAQIPGFNVSLILDNDYIFIDNSGDLNEVIYKPEFDESQELN